jgi:hypothetical protein
VRERGGVDRVAVVVADWRDTCPRRGGCARVAILTTILVVEPQTHPTLWMAGFRPGLALKPGRGRSGGNRR